MFYNILEVFHIVKRHFTSLPEKEPVIVYTMRKVGSTTITGTLRQNNIKTYKHHCLNPKNNYGYQDSLKKANNPIQHWLKDGILFRHQLDRWEKRRLKNDSKDKCKVITIVKDPIAINLSDCFTQLVLDFPYLIADEKLESVQDYCDWLVGIIAKSVDTKRTYSDYFQKLVDFPSHWFNSELKTVFNVDVFAEKFSRVRGYQIYKGETAEVLLIRTENINERAKEALSEFFHCDIKELANKNLTTEYSTGAIYKSIRDTIKFPENFVNSYYEQSYIKHFYSEEEIRKFKSKWIKN